MRDKDGKEVGKSSKAGIMACSQVAFSRCMSSLPCLTIPPVLMGWLENTSLLKKHPSLATPINFGMKFVCRIFTIIVTIGVLLLTALPVAVAVFPQEAQVPVSKLEPQFQKMKDRTGKPLEFVYFNRGL